MSAANLSFTLTNAGQDAAFNLGVVNLEVTHVQLGSGNRTPSGGETALTTPQETSTISAHHEVSAGQHRMAAVIAGSAQNYYVSEIGLWSGVPGGIGSVLVFYWALPTGYVAVKSVDVDFNFETDIFFGGVVPANITIVADTQFNALSMIAAHNIDPLAHTGLVPQATETVKGIAEIATQAETNAGTDDARIVTPLKLAAALSSATSSSLAAHVAAADPHTGYATDADLAAHNADLDAHAARRVVFKAVKNGVDQSIPSSVATKLTWAAAVIDTHEAFSANKFTAPVTGMYRLTLTAKCTPSAPSGGALAVEIYLNGSLSANSVARFGGNTTTSCSAHTLINMAAGDYVEAYAWQDTISAQDIEGGNGVTMFFGELI